ncbi:uncharacterized protein V6R79_005645 [Siganus canaliculatus]
MSLDLSVPGQFDDAEEDSSQSELPVLLSQMSDVTVEPPSEEEEEEEEEEEDDDDDDEEWAWRSTGGDLTKRYTGLNSQANRQNLSNKMLPSTPTDKALRKYENKINLDKLNYADSVINKVTSMQKQKEADTYRVKDKSDRATVEQVLDPRTRMILFKMLNRGVISEINGCISTGKEANVYQASTCSGDSRAIKIYKTSILLFKDRDKYVSGEFRFRHGYCKGNPRKMVRTWAEKEMRNLIRLQTAGIPSPRPLLLRSHVLLMGFIGRENMPAPLLKNASLSESKARELYLQVIHNMRTMFQEARLVHADLSEFNILYHDGDAYIIDVSQSVEHDHPHALEFLRKDCSNINEFFVKRGVAVMTVRELFDFITDPSITCHNIEPYLDKVMVTAAERTAEQRTDQDRVDEEVFKKAYIPRTLTEVSHYERDVDLMRTKEEESAISGHSDNVLYQTLTGLKKDLSGVQKIPAILEDESSSSEEEEEEEEQEQEEEEEEEQKEEAPADRKEKKKMIKEAQREKRKSKVPKHVKKRKEKVSKMKKGRTAFVSFWSGSLYFVLFFVLFFVIMADWTECLDFGISVTRQASEMILAAFEQRKDVKLKSSVADLVTETDQRVENVLISTIRKQYPEHRFIGEESVAAGEPVHLTEHPTWIIDPIDGTVNFVHRFPFVAVSIAFAVNKQTEFGIVYSCVEDKLFYAQRGRGAFLNGRPLRASGQEDVSRCVVVTEIGAQRDDLSLSTMTSNILRLLQLPVHGVRALGTAAVDMCQVATGGADAYYHIGMHCWDIAASAIIVQEAGGVVVDTDGLYLTCEPMFCLLGAWPSVIGPCVSSGSQFDMMSRKVIAASSSAVASRIAQVIQAFPCHRDDEDL